MTLNVDYDLAAVDPRGPYVRAALPEDWRAPSLLVDPKGDPLPSETDDEMAERCGAIFGFLPGWSVHRDAQGNLALYDVLADPPPPAPATMPSGAVVLFALNASLPTGWKSTNGAAIPPPGYQFARFTG